MRLSNEARQAARESYYQTLSSWLAGGKMQVFAANAELLVEIPFPEDVAIATHTGFTYHNIKDQTVQKLGDPVRFVMLAQDGRQVFEGSIGTAEDSDILVDEMNKRFFPGMKFGLDEFTYDKI